MKVGVGVDRIPRGALAGRRTNQTPQKRCEREDQDDFKRKRNKQPRPRSKDWLVKHGQ